MRRAIFAAIACAALTLQTAVASLQQRDAGGQRVVPTGTSSIGGIVVTDEAPAKPLGRVTVTLTETSAVIMTRMATSNDAGRFLFRDLPAGRYMITANLPPYLSAAYGAKRVAGPGSVQTGTAIVLANGQQINDLSIRLMRGGVITGTIRDIDATPARGAMVTIAYFQRSLTTGDRQLTTYYGSVGFSGSQTDDRGVYRIYGLPPGEYVVSAAFPFGRSTDLVVTSDADIRQAMDLIQRPRQPSATATAAPSNLTPPRKPTAGYVPVFYPGTTTATRAVPVTLGVGEERTDLDIQLQRVSTSRVEGLVIGADGAPVARAPVRTAVNNSILQLGMAADLGIAMGSNTTTDAQGRFVLNGLAPGAYVVQSVMPPPTPGGPMTFAISELDVQGEDSRVTLTLQPAIIVTGKVVFDASTATPPQDLSRIRLTLVASSASPGMTGAQGSVQPNGQVTFTGVPAGRYRLTAAVNLPAAQNPWMLTSATIKGQESLDSLVEIRAGESPDVVVTFSDRYPELSGTMTDASGQPAPEYFIVLFAEDRAYWTPGTRRILQTRPSHDGKFAFKGLPPGDYRLAAVTDMQQGEWLDPAFLEQLAPASVKVTLGVNEKKVQDLRVGR